MKQVHVTDDGRVMNCTASQKLCSYSKREDGNRHFTSAEEAAAKANELLKSSYQTFNTHRKTIRPKRTKSENKNSVISVERHSLSNNRFMPMKPVDLPDEFFSEFKAECAKSLSV